MSWALKGTPAFLRAALNWATEKQRQKSLKNENRKLQRSERATETNYKYRLSTKGKVENHQELYKRKTANFSKSGF